MKQSVSLMQTIELRAGRLIQVKVKEINLSSQKKQLATEIQRLRDFFLNKCILLHITKVSSLIFPFGVSRNRFFLCDFPCVSEPLWRICRF